MHPVRFIGEHDEYFWGEVWNAGDLKDLVCEVPELIVGKYVVITAFDSGPLHPSSDERARGWTSEFGVTYTERMSAGESIKSALYDEWYVFSAPKKLGEVPLVYINLPIFTLVDPQQLVEKADDADCDLEATCKEVMALQQDFWDQLCKYDAETYLAQDDHRVIVATNRRELRDKVVASLHRNIR